MRKLFKWEYLPSGNCPVQSEGVFLGYYFYFRSRGQLSTIDFYKDKGDRYLLDNEVFYCELYKTKDMYKAGYLHPTICKRLIYKGCFLFLLNRLTNTYKN